MFTPGEHLPPIVLVDRVAEVGAWGLLSCLGHEKPGR